MLFIFSLKILSSRQDSFEQTVCLVCFTELVEVNNSLRSLKSVGNYLRNIYFLVKYCHLNIVVDL